MEGTNKESERKPLPLIDQVRWLFRLLGFQMNDKGKWYMEYSIQLVMLDGSLTEREIADRIVEKVAPSLITTRRRVLYCCRSAILRAWSRKPEIWDDIAGRHLEAPPSVEEFHVILTNLLKTHRFEYSINPEKAEAIYYLSKL